MEFKTIIEEIVLTQNLDSWKERQARVPICIITIIIWMTLNKIMFFSLNFRILGNYLDRHLFDTICHRSHHKQLYVKSSVVFWITANIADDLSKTSAKILTNNTVFYNKIDYPNNVFPRFFVAFIARINTITQYTMQIRTSGLVKSRRVRE